MRLSVQIGVDLRTITRPTPEKRRHDTSPAGSKSVSDHGNSRSAIEQDLPVPSTSCRLRRQPIHPDVVTGRRKKLVMKNMMDRESISIPA
jgi:hypothetical protein